jgi:hypothetical protein
MSTRTTLPPLLACRKPPTDRPRRSLRNTLHWPHGLVAGDAGVGKTTAYEKSKRVWHKWLNRRSQRSRLQWERFVDFLRDFSLPRPRIVVRFWG